MTDVVIAGIGQIPVGEHWDLSPARPGAGGHPGCPARMPAGCDRRCYMWRTCLLRYVPPGAPGCADGRLSPGWLGLKAATIEAGGASGGAALRMGYLAVASGEADVALVVGVEKDHRPARAGSGSVADAQRGQRLRGGAGLDPDCSGGAADAALHARIPAAAGSLWRFSRCWRMPTRCSNPNAMYPQRI